MKSVVIKLRTNAQRDYIRLTDIMNWFEPDIKGGNNKSCLAKRMATIQYGNQPAVLDDIDESKGIFRKRAKSLAQRFLNENNLSIGDAIKVERLAPYTYRFSKP